MFSSKGRVDTLDLFLNLIIDVCFSLVILISAELALPVASALPCALIGNPLCHEVF